MEPLNGTSASCKADRCTGESKKVVSLLPLRLILRDRNAFFVWREFGCYDRKSSEDFPRVCSVSLRIFSVLRTLKTSDPYDKLHCGGHSRGFALTSAKGGGGLRSLRHRQLSPTALRTNEPSSAARPRSSKQPEATAQQFSRSRADSLATFISDARKIQQHQSSRRNFVSHHPGPVFASSVSICRVECLTIWSGHCAAVLARLHNLFVNVTQGRNTFNSMFDIANHIALTLTTAPAL